MVKSKKFSLLAAAVIGVAGVGLRAASAASIDFTDTATFATPGLSNLDTLGGSGTTISLTSADTFDKLSYTATPQSFSDVTVPTILTLGNFTLSSTAILPSFFDGRDTFTVDISLSNPSGSADQTNTAAISGFVQSNSSGISLVFATPSLTFNTGSGASIAHTTFNFIPTFIGFPPPNGVSPGTQPLQVQITQTGFASSPVPAPASIFGLIGLFSLLALGKFKIGTSSLA